jgi:hypothetical protein
MTGAIGLGILVVSGLNLVPNPPARMTAFIEYLRMSGINAYFYYITQLPWIQ